MFCKKCGKQLNNVARFCDGCGENTSANSFNNTHNKQNNQQNGRLVLIIAVIFIAIFLFAVPMVKCGSMCVQKHTVIQSITGNANFWKK